MKFDKTPTTFCTLALCMLASCGGGGSGDVPLPITPAPVVTPAPVTPMPVVAQVPPGDMVALGHMGKIFTFNRAAPDTIVTSLTASGLVPGDALVSIAVRSGDQQLYGLGRLGNLYRIDMASAKAVGTIVLKARAGDAYSGLTGSHWSLAFNPISDLARVVSTSGQNLSINVDTGEVTVEGAIRPRENATLSALQGYAPAATTITAIAYTESFRGTGETDLYLLDAVAGRLFYFLQRETTVASDGVAAPLFEQIGVQSEISSGLVIDPRTNVGYGAPRVNGASALYTLPFFGEPKATRVGIIGTGETVLAIAIAPVASPSGMVLSSNNELMAFDLRNPSKLTVLPVTGTGSARLLGIDFHPCDARMYGVGSDARLYTVDPDTGAATLRAALFADPADTSSPYTGLRGTVTVVDFDPSTSRLRVMTSQGQNLSVNVGSGATVTDDDLRRSSFPYDRVPVSTPLSVSAAAYHRNACASPSEWLEGFDQVTQNRVSILSPVSSGFASSGFVSSGTLSPLPFDRVGGFDIVGGSDGLSLVAGRQGPNGPYTLYSNSGAYGAPLPYIPGNLKASVLGGPTGPSNIIDLAIRF